MHGKSFGAGVVVGAVGWILLMSLNRLFVPLLVIALICVVAYFIFGGRDDRPPA